MDIVRWARKRANRVLIYSENRLSLSEIVRQKTLYKMEIMPEDVHGPFPRFMNVGVRPNRYASHAPRSRRF